MSIHNPKKGFTLKPITRINQEQDQLTKRYFVHAATNTTTTATSTPNTATNKILQLGLLLYLQLFVRIRVLR